ncbi:MAG TPA: PAS domain-containing protein [Opitutaceae bacterium]|nr:PAS domain-containing protein [Opitutaceae bacterium]
MEPVGSAPLNAPIGERLPTPVVGAGKSPVRVLVVEDHEEDFHFLAMLLERSQLEERYDLDWASSFDDGIARLESGRYDAGLFDYALGGSTGLDLLRAARARGADMPVILLTGVDNPQIDGEALRSGAADYLCKAELTAVQLERTIRYARQQAATLAQLRRANNLLSTVLNGLPVVVYRIDGDGVLLESRGQGLRLLGIADDELVGRNVFDAWPHIADDVRRALAGSAVEFVAEIRHGDERRYFDNYVQFDRARGHGAVGFSIDATARVFAEQQRRIDAQMLHNILRNLSAIAGRLDAEGRVVEALGAGLRRYGLAAGRLHGQLLTDVIPHCGEAIERALAGGSTAFTFVGRSQNEDWYVDFSVSFDAENGEGAVFFGRDVTERRRLERLVLNLGDAERQRIGADLHDGLGQHLTGLACLAAALRERMAAVAPAEAESAAHIAELANEATVQSRALARGLSAVQLEVHGLAAALEDLALQSQRLHGVECVFSLRGLAPTMDHLAAIHVYRIAQEAIHNAVRHGGARRIRLALLGRPERHRLLVLDDGAGFEVSPATPSKGSGLRLMHYRATMLGGSVIVHSRPGQGTRVACNWTQPSINEN